MKNLKKLKTVTILTEKQVRVINGGGVLIENIEFIAPPKKGGN